MQANKSKVGLNYSHFPGESWEAKSYPPHLPFWRSSRGKNVFEIIQCNHQQRLPLDAEILDKWIHRDTKEEHQEKRVAFGDEFHHAGYCNAFVTLEQLQSVSSSAT